MKRSSIAWARSSIRRWKARPRTTWRRTWRPKFRKSVSRASCRSPRASARRSSRRRSASRMKVLVDSVEGNTAIARSEGDAPEIDGVVKIVKGGKLPARRVRGRGDHGLERSRSRGEDRQISLSRRAPFAGQARQRNARELHVFLVRGVAHVEMILPDHALRIMIPRALVASLEAQRLQTGLATQ